MNRLRVFLSGRAGPILVIVLAAALGASLATNLSGRDAAYATDQKTVTQQQRAALYELQNAFTSLVDEVLPSVVSIESKWANGSRAVPPEFDEFFKDFPFPFPFPQPNKPNAPDQQPALTSYGSGVIVRSDGYILTNDHVVGGADKVTVKLKDGRELQGVVSRDPRSDLALVKIDAKNLPAAKLGDSSKVKAGSWAIAIGSPFELDQTVTVGVVSAIGRQGVASDGDETRFYPNLIQTDASINPGNSGGPLINIDGEVIGINTLIRASFDRGNIGIGFAIPVNTAKFVLDQLIEHGKVTRGYLGIKPTDVTPKSAERYGTKEGSLVQSVEVGSPADKAGVQVEDVIVEFDGKKIANEIELRDAIAATPPAKKVSMVVVRDRVRKTLEVTLTEAPALQAAESPKESSTKLGFSVANITPQMAEKYKLEEGTEGVVVTKAAPGSTATRAGIQVGQVIFHVNGKPVQTVEEFDAGTKDLKSGDTLSLRARTKERTMLIEFTID